MRRLLCLIFGLTFCITAHADTINVNWIVDGNTYDTSTCTVGGDLILPTPPTPETGYHFVGWEVARYAKLEYIESTGTQYIDTGYKLNTTTDDVELVFMATSNSDGNSLFGARSSSSKDVYSFAISATFYYRTGWGNSTPWTTTLDDNQKHTIKIEYDGGVFKLDGAVINTMGNSSIITPVTATLFAIQASSATTVYPSTTKIYSYSLWRNYVLTQNLIPVQRTSDGEIGMYDTVSGTFFTNAGTGDFIAGPETGEYIY